MALGLFLLLLFFSGRETAARAKPRENSFAEKTQTERGGGERRRRRRK